MAIRTRQTPLQQLRAEVRGQRASVARHKANVANWVRLSRGHDTAQLRNAQAMLADEQVYLAQLQQQLREMEAQA